VNRAWLVSGLRRDVGLITPAISCGRHQALQRIRLLLTIAPSASANRWRVLASPSQRSSSFSPRLSPAAAVTDPPCEGSEDWVAVCLSQRHFLYVQIDNAAIHVQAIGTDGKVFDSVDVPVPAAG